MPKPLSAPALALVFCAVVAGWPGPALATEADTQKMIEALMPTATRSLRNLVVRQKVEPVAGAASAAPAGHAPGAASPAAVAQAGAVAGAADAAGTVAPTSSPPRPPDSSAPSLALSIQFEPNSSRVRAESGSLLGSLVAALQSPELKASRFIIEGHADARGAAQRNLRLSQERAEEVRLYLVALGVHPSRLRAVGRGNSQPVNSSDPAAPENRRVRVVTVE